MKCVFKPPVPNELDWLNESGCTHIQHRNVSTSYFLTILCDVLAIHTSKKHVEIWGQTPPSVPMLSMKNIFYTITTPPPFGPSLAQYACMHIAHKGMLVCIR